jgi:hypothetical protein
LRALFRRPIDDLLAAMETLVADGNPYLGMLLLLVGLSLSWFAYVPIHELLHALGCAGTGGNVTVLEVQHIYGGELLARVFPFVVPGGEYAGRLSGFDTHGSDLVYLATDALPFALSVLLGVPLLRLCTRRRRPLLLGPAAVLGLAPLYNLPGDYFEMGSILATRAAGALAGTASPLHPALRSDNVFRLLERFFVQPAELGLTDGTQIATAGLLIAVSLALAVLLAFSTYALGSGVATLIGVPRQVDPQREEEEE